jgi:pimeloyl-ACP methyl ester carboxylesterase
MHFLHANGYPPGCYDPFLKRAREKYQVDGMLLRPLWPDSDPMQIHDWNPFSRDLLEYLKQKDSPPVIAVGHSIGAIVTLRAALWEPGKFRALVLFDPVLLDPGRILLLNAARWLGQVERVNPRIVGAITRRRHFNSLDSMFTGYRKRGIFRHFDDDTLRSLIRGLTRASPEGGYDLVYSPEWEARIYGTGAWRDLDLWLGLPRLKVPTLIVRGADTDTFTAGAARLVKLAQPAVRVETLAGSTHLLPLERPAQVFDIMHTFLREVP